MVYRVGLVLDAEFGERLADLAARMTVWGLDSETNRAAATRCWATNEGSDLERGITLFPLIGGISSPEDIAPKLEEIGLRHDEHSQTPVIDSLEIFGCTTRAVVVDALASVGYTVVETRDDWLRATPVGREDEPPHSLP